MLKTHYFVNKIFRVFLEQGLSSYGLWAESGPQSQGIIWGVEGREGVDGGSTAVGEVGERGEKNGCQAGSGSSPQDLEPFKVPATSKSLPTSQSIVDRFICWLFFLRIFEGWNLPYL